MTTTSLDWARIAAPLLANCSLPSSRSLDAVTAGALLLDSYKHPATTSRARELCYHSPPPHLHPSSTFPSPPPLALRAAIAAVEGYYQDIGVAACTTRAVSGLQRFVPLPLLLPSPRGSPVTSSTARGWLTLLVLCSRVILKVAMERPHRNSVRSPSPSSSPPRPCNLPVARCHP